MVDRQELHEAYNTVWQYAVNRLGYEVYEGPDMQDVCMSDVKEINICSRKGVEKKLYSLLHECGHALIRENWSKFPKSSLPMLNVDMMGEKTAQIIIASLLLKRNMRLGSVASALQSVSELSLMKKGLKSTKYSV